MIVKLTTPWAHDFYRRMPFGEGVIGDYKFEIDNTVDHCDYWIIWGDLREVTRVKCPPDNVFFITSEAHEQKKYSSDFLEQFSAIITQRSDISHSNIIKTHDLGIWHLPQNYEEVNQIQTVAKSKVMSAVASDLTHLEGHKLRFAFINQLMGHYKREIDFFGRGINYVDNKYEALAPYRYSIAIENSFLPDYFTEKLFECFLTLTLPLYYGCPNLEKYFDDRAFVRIDIKDLNGAISIIDDLIKYDVQRERLEYLKEAKKMFLDEYMVFPALARILSHTSSSKAKKKLCVISPERYFLPTSFKILNGRHVKKYVWMLRQFRR